MSKRFDCTLDRLEFALKESGGNPVETVVPTGAKGAKEVFKASDEPLVNKDAWQTLEEVLDLYDHERPFPVEEFPATAARRLGYLVIRGVRGQGKTHLLTRFGHNHGSRMTLVSPQTLYDDTSFEEYLLSELTDVLTKSLSDPNGALRTVADRFTRHLLVRAFSEITDREWTALAHQPTLLDVLLRRSCPITGKPPAPETIRTHLTSSKQIQEPLKKIGIGDVAPRVLKHHLAMTQPRESSAEAIVYYLYEELVNLGLGGLPQQISDFLGENYANIEAPVRSSRETKVSTLLRTLTDLLYLFGRPMVLAFDRLEDLVGDPADSQRVSYLTTGLAALSDERPDLTPFRGFPVLIFAEETHYSEYILPKMSDYARARFAAGLPQADGRNLPNEIMLSRQLAPEAIERVIRRRLKTIPGLADEVQQCLAQHFPYPLQKSDLEELSKVNEFTGETLGLRQLLIDLKGRYKDRLWGTHPPPQHRSPPDGRSGARGIEEPPAAPRWRELMRQTREELNGNPPSKFQENATHGLVSAVVRLLRAAGMPAKVEPRQFGDHPIYGHYVHVQWPDRKDVLGVGLLLGRSQGMPLDLEQKITLRTTDRVQKLMVFRPTANTNSRLTGKTGELWKQAVESDSLRGTMWLDEICFDMFALLVALGRLEWGEGCGELAATNDDLDQQIQSDFSFFAERLA